jgi:DNA-binding LacI/PurR family transcriptional regulator
VRIARKRIYRGDFRAASGRAAMEGWLRSSTPPTAVFAENDLMAVGVLSAAHAADVEVPTQVSVVGFDGIAFGADVTPPLTTVAQSTNDVAATAVELLFERLHDSHASPRRVELPVALLVRGTSGPPPGR